MDTPKAPLFTKLYTDFQRTGLSHDGTLAGIRLGDDHIHALLDLPEQTLDAATLELSALSGILPVGTINPLHRQRYEPQRWPGQSELVRLTADGLRHDPDPAKPVDEARLLDLLAKKEAYQEFALLGQRIKDRGMDLRAINGAWMWFLADEIMRWLGQTMVDPATTEADKAELLDCFAPALLVMDGMLGHSSQQKQAIAAARGNLSEQLKEKQAQAADARTELAVRHDLPVSQQALLEAARRHAAKASSPGAAGTSVPGQLGRIIE